VPEQIDANNFSAEEFGHIAHSLLQNMLSSASLAKPDDDILEHLRQGRWTFLFDKKRRFIDNSI
jgi:hypothetical protein